MTQSNAQGDTGYYVHPSSIVDLPVEIGAGTKIWHFCHIMSGASIGRDCSFGQNCFVAKGVRIGDNARVQNNVSIYEGVEIEEDVFCGPSMVFTNVLNPRSAVSRKDEYRKTLIRRGATIGANATVVCGYTIGQYAMIGAGAVVTRDVPDFALVVGMPGRVVGWISRNGQRLSFGPDGMAVCSATGERYRKLDAHHVVLEREK